MLPAVAGGAETKRQIFTDSLLLAPVSILPWALGFAGPVYGATSVVSSATVIALAAKLRISAKAVKRSARCLFAFSIVYLFVLFATLAIDSMLTHT